MDEQIKKYETERDELIENIKKDYDAKIKKIRADKPKKEVVGDNDVEKDKIEIGEETMAMGIANTTDLSGIKSKGNK